MVEQKCHKLAKMCQSAFIPLYDRETQYEKIIIGQETSKLGLQLTIVLIVSQWQDYDFCTKVDNCVKHN